MKNGFLGGFLGGLIPVLGAGLVAGFGVIFIPIGLAIAGAAIAAWEIFIDSGKAFFAGVADRINQGWTETTGYLTSKWDQGLPVTMNMDIRRSILRELKLESVFISLSTSMISIRFP